MNKLRYLIIALSSILLCACMGSPSLLNRSFYDLGAAMPFQPLTLNNGIVSVQISAPDWLDQNYLYYRFTHAEPNRLYRYRESRWIDRPSVLLQSKINARWSNIDTKQKSTYLLKLDLLDFSQIFESQSYSQGRVIARATLIDRVSQNRVAQHVFRVEHIAPSPNAQGGVQAINLACDQLLEFLTKWVNENLSNEQGL